MTTKQKIGFFCYVFFGILALIFAFASFKVVKYQINDIPFFIGQLIGACIWPAVSFFLLRAARRLKRRTRINEQEKMINDFLTDDPL